MYLILDAGHTNIVDPGACANNTTEHAEVVLIANALSKQLAKASRLVKVVPTDLTLVQKIAWVNKNSTVDDVLLSLHLNSASADATGAMVYYYTGSGTAELRATRFIKNYCDLTKQKNRGALGDTTNRHGRLGIIRDTTPFAFLIELGFITNLSDLNVVRTQAVSALAQSISLLFNETMPTPSPHAAAVAEAVQLGLSNGERPTQPATREEVIHMLVNLYHLLKK